MTELQKTQLQRINHGTDTQACRIAAVGFSECRSVINIIVSIEAEFFGG